MTHKILSVLAGAAVLTLSAAATAAMVSGPQLCVPDAANPGPRWWKPNTDPADVELQFAAGATLGPVHNDAVAQARALWDPQHDRALIRVDVDDVEALDPEDAFVFAVSDSTGERPELLVRFRPLIDCLNPAACGGRGVGVDSEAIDYAYATALTSPTWTPLGPKNPMFGRSVKHPWIQTHHGDDGQLGWTLTFAIELPTDIAGDIAPDVRVFGSVVDRIHGITSDTELELPVLCESGSPTSDECIMSGIGEIEVPDDLPTAVESSWALLSTTC